MAFTDVRKLAEAMHAMNSARQVVSADYCSIKLVRNRFVVGKSATSGGSFWFGMNDTRRAADCINAVLKANPGVRVIEDEKGSWIAVCRT